MELLQRWYQNIYLTPIELPKHLENIGLEQLLIGIGIILSIFYLIFLGRSDRVRIILNYLKYRSIEAYRFIRSLSSKTSKASEASKASEDKENFVFKDEDPNSNLDDGLKAKNILDTLLENKFEYYMYKEILPLYLGNQKKAPITNEKFKELKNTFYHDIKLSISPVLIRRLNYVLTPEGIGIYIHSKFATMFNKIDSKFVNKNDVLEKDTFFMI